MKKMIAVGLCALMLCGCESAAEDIINEVETAEVTEISAETAAVTAVSEAVTTVTEPSPLSGIEKQFLGFWVNKDNPYEQWQFFRDGRAKVASEELTFSAESGADGLVLSLSDGRSFGARIDRDGISLSDGDVIIQLYEEGSPEVLEARKMYRLYSENAVLFDKFPDESGWLDCCEYGDIPFLADAEYIEKSLTDGIFVVSSPVELASFNYIVNTSDRGQYCYMELACDIDLSGYRWVPMGWHGGEKDMPFTCVVDGKGHSIKNMRVEIDEGEAGFIGWETFCGVRNITFEDAYVKGDMMVGIISGQAICGMYENCHVSGEVIGGSAGSMLGHSTADVIDCTADVIVNGQPFDFLTYNEKKRNEIVIEDPVEITLDGYTVTRLEVEGYHNLGWQVFYNGREVLHRNAEGEYSYTYFMRDPGTYEIYLSAFVDGQYVPISNTVSYTIEEY